MNDQKIKQAFQKITAQADACPVEKNVKEHHRKKNSTVTKRPVRAAAVLAAVLVLIMVPIAAFGVVYGYRTYHTDHGYAVTIEAGTAPIKLDEQTMAELGQYILRFEDATVNISDIGKRFDSWDALDTWLGGILCTSPMLDGEPIVYCTDDSAGTPIAVHISGVGTVLDTGKMCAVNVTIPLAALGEEFDWMTKGTDMLSAQNVTAENGITAEFVTTETSVTAYFMHDGILYRLNIADNQEDAAAVLTDMIGTMQ